MNHKSILQAVTVMSLVMSSAWAAEDTNNHGVSLAENPARTEVVVAKKDKPVDGQVSVSRLPTNTTEIDEDRVVDCYYEYNDSHPVCQEAKSHMR